jgi:protocatechuate 3,4-dioxygenase beta subunit
MSIVRIGCHIALGLVLLIVPAASRTVHGTVTDQEGKPVAGAAVRLKTQ